MKNESIDCKIDDSNKRPGEKFFYWEMKGVPFRIEIGEKELEDKELIVFIRDIKEKIKIEKTKISSEIKKLAKEYDERLIGKANGSFEKRVIDCDGKDEIKKALDKGNIARFSFCSREKEGEGCAGFIEKELQARVMGTRADISEKTKGKCPFCGKPAQVIVYAGKSY